jgi:indole-3-glycerol phosphate synthase
VTDILSQILEQKHREVEIARSAEPLEQLIEKAKTVVPSLDFFGALQTPRVHNNIALIAEVKKASPSKGLLCPDFDPAKLGQAYANAGASAISVLTDEKFFQGHLSYLEIVKQAAGGNIPVLRKDFMVDPYQVWQARVYGADAILLIMAALEDGQAAELFDLATELEMASLVEVHNAAELHRAVKLGANIIGINNRDLRTFQTDLAVTEQLVAELGDLAAHLIVSESGIATADDISRLDSIGVRAVLIGETLVKAASSGDRLDTSKITEIVKQLFLH